MTDTAPAPDAAGGDGADGADESVRCSAWARSVSLSPVGTAGSYAGYVLVEVPLPWPRDVSEMPFLGPVAAWAASVGYRVQALVPRPERGRRLVVHAAPVDDAASASQWFSGYVRRSVAVDGATAEDLAALAEALAASAASEPDGHRDVLVCTHGRRDTCCGSAGTALALELTSGGGFDGPDGDAAAVSGPAGHSIVVHRTSHTGGHRFAPTFLVLPEATAWAFADPDLVRSVVDRTVDFGSVADHYRGCAGLGGPRVQALEREVLRRVGWDLLDRPRRGVAVGADSPVVRLEVRGRDGPIDTWEADVVPGRTLPVPECMKPLSEARKTETEWVVQGLRRL